jgi:hypothetical protein
VAKQKLAAASIQKAAEEQTNAHTPVTKPNISDDDIMEIDPIATHTSPSAMLAPNVTSSMISVPAGISPAPDMDVDALFNEAAANTSTPNPAVVETQPVADDDMDLFGEDVDTNPGDGASLLPGLDSYVSLPDTSTISNPTATAATSQQPAATAAPELTLEPSADVDFDFANMDFPTDLGTGDDGQAGDVVITGDGDDGDDFQSWLASIG